MKEESQVAAQKQRFKLVTDKKFYKRVLSIMLPVALQQAINMGVNMLDTIMLGQFGEVQISSSSLANQYYNFFTIFCMGIIGGSSVLAAQYWGAREVEKVRQTFNMALRMALTLASVFAVLTWCFPAQIMSIYTSEAHVVEQGVRYLRITTFVFIIHGTSLVAAQLMRSVGQAQLGLIVSCVSFVVNLIANYAFIFGKFGAPRMEIAGAALGTLLARTSEFLACDGRVKTKLTARKSISSAVLGGEGFFNLSLVGRGAVALESNVPEDELIEVELENDELKIDGNLAVCWSSNLDFTVERSTGTLVGSAVSGEGLVNVYRGTGRVLMSPVAPTDSLPTATNTTQANPAVKNNLPPEN